MTKRVKNNRITGSIPFWDGIPFTFSCNAHILWCRCGYARGNRCCSCRNDVDVALFLFDTDDCNSSDSVN